MRLVNDDTGQAICAVQLVEHPEQRVAFGHLLWCDKQDLDSGLGIPDTVSAAGLTGGGG